MKKVLFSALALAFTFSLGYTLNAFTIRSQETILTTMGKNEAMKLGTFSMSLSVKDLKVSKKFYQNIGFSVFAGSMEQNYFIMKNGNALIGIFQGMFQGNILTFNPGWDENAKNMESFDDIRKIHKHVKEKGLKVSNEVDEKASGPASFMLTDPDGNAILFDQHR